MRTARLGSAIALIALLTGGPARAQEPTPEAMAAAEAAFDEGKRLLGQKRFEEACGKLEESQRLAPASGTLLNLGDCYERLGRTATAWATFRAAAASARSKGKASRESEARARATALEPRLAKLRVVVPAEARVAGLEVRRGELVLGESLWGVPVPVDPGSHAITATAPAHAAWTQSIAVPAKAGVVEIAVPKLDAAPAGAGAPTAPESPSSAGGDGLGAQRVAALVIGGLGVVAIGLGVGFGVDAIKTKDASNAEGGCKDNLCPQAGLELRDRAVTEAHVSTGLFIGAGVALAGATALWLTAPGDHDGGSAPKPPRSLALLDRAHVAIAAGPGGASLRVGASW